MLPATEPATAALSDSDNPHCATQTRWRSGFWVALVITIVVLLAPASAVLAAKTLVLDWLPWGQQVDTLSTSQYGDKWVHGGLFFLLAWLAGRAWTQPQHVWLALTGLCLLAPTTEWLQNFVPGRSASWGDVLADILGLMLGYALTPSVWPSLRRRPHC